MATDATLTKESIAKELYQTIRAQHRVVPYGDTPEACIYYLNEVKPSAAFYLPPEKLEILAGDRSTALTLLGHAALACSFSVDSFLCNVANFASSSPESSAYKISYFSDDSNNFSDVRKKYHNALERLEEARIYFDTDKDTSAVAESFRTQSALLNIGINALESILVDPVKAVELAQKVGQTTPTQDPMKALYQAIEIMGNQSLRVNTEGLTAHLQAGRNSQEQTL
jgi:hypothetical protein